METYLGLPVSHKGGRKPAIPLQVLLVRELEQEDFSSLAEAAPPVGENTIMRIRARHHEAARMLAMGMSGVEVSLATGYAQTSLSIFQKDPAFRDLMQHYATEREIIALDAMQKLNALGEEVVEVLRERLETDSDGFDNRMLLDIANVAIVKPRTASVGGGTGAGAGGSPVQINLKFVGGTPANGVIDVEGKEV
jgi:hypothetical protein